MVSKWRTEDSFSPGLQYFSGFRNACNALNLLREDKTKYFDPTEIINKLTILQESFYELGNNEEISSKDMFNDQIILFDEYEELLISIKQNSSIARTFSAEIGYLICDINSICKK